MAQPSKNELLVAALLAFAVTFATALLLRSLLVKESSTSKVCPTHQPEPLELPITEFGIARARSDGLNLYCKSCIRKKVAESRRALKEYRALRRQNAQLRLTPIKSDSPPVTLSPSERVREAIRKGARTQSEIRQDTGLYKDQIGDAIAELLLWTREIKTETVNNARLYFINHGDTLPIREAANAPARQADVRAEANESWAAERKWRAG